MATESAPRVDAPRPQVVFLCQRNDCRSQMAEAILRHLAPDRFGILSAGSDPAPCIHPLALEVLHEMGVDTGTQHPKPLAAIAPGLDNVLAVIAVCGQIRPVVGQAFAHCRPQAALYWPTDDPSDIPGTEDERRRLFRHTRDKLWGRMIAWLESARACPF